MSTPRATAEACVDAGFAFLRYLRSRKPEEQANLSLPQLRTLHLLALNPETSRAALADQLCVSPPALSKMVDALVERGLVARTTAPGDRRRVALSLTAAGTAALADAREGLVAHMAGRVKALGPADRAALVRSLGQVREVLA